MTERKFTRALNKPGMAAQLRETVSQVVRESAVLNKPLVVQPMDFEGFISKNKTLIQNDPHRELLIYPNDDVSEVIITRNLRTTFKSITDRFEAPNESIVCPLQNSNANSHNSTNVNLHNSNSRKNSILSQKSPCNRQTQLNQQAVVSNGSLSNNNLMRRSSHASPNISAITSPTSSQDSYESVLENASQSSSTSTLKSNNLAQPEEDDDLDNIGDSADNNSYVGQRSKAECSRFTRQALHTYKSKNHLIHYKYSAYGGTIHDLPKLNSSDALREEVYEIDVDQDRIDEQMTKSQADSITKQGYLLKGPDSGSDRMFANIGNKSFKRRYCYLRQEVDGTYILELHKDEKQGEAKATIVMDFCTDVVQNPKRGRFCFELRMTTGHKSFTLAAENEDDFKDWLNKLYSVLQQNKIQEDKRVASLERTPPPCSSTALFGTLKGLEQSMNPQLIKYGRETDISIAQARRENRRRLFGNLRSSSLKAAATDNVQQYREQFGKKIFLKCRSLNFRLQCSNDVGEHMYQVEPYITSLALYDVRTGSKLTESFYFNINDDEVSTLLPSTPVPTSVATTKIPRRDTHDDRMRSTSTAFNSLFENLSTDLLRCPKEHFAQLKQAIFSVNAPHADIFLVLKIEKILQGNIIQATEPYLKTNRDFRVAQKLHKTIKNYAQNIGHYRQPFAWAAKPLFKLYSSDLDTENKEFEFTTLYRQDVNKIKDDELLKFLIEYRRLDKLSKLTIVPGTFKLIIEEVEGVKGILTKSLMPLDNCSFPLTTPTLQITEFQTNYVRDCHPYTSFCNHMFVYPISLQFDSQKIFSRARNITVVIELRDSDCENSKPLKCIYGRPGHDFLVSQIASPVLHHNATPTWYEEVKIRLPLGIFPEHHLLFSFYHVSCNLSKKRDTTVAFEIPIGYAWLPLLQRGKIHLGEQMMPVAATLPVGYLSIQPLGLGRGQYSGPDIQWVDNQRPLFHVSVRMDSTVHTADQHLHNFFLHCERLLEDGKTTAMPAETETCKVLKAAHAIDIVALINYLPTLLNELFTLLVHTQSEEVGLNIIRLIINIIHMITEEAGRKELLATYVKYIFFAPYFCQKSNRTVHGELCRYLPTILNPCNTDFLVVNKFMHYSGIFFDLIIKSMAQHLLDTRRIRMLRNERFPLEYHDRVENLIKILIPYLISRYKSLPVETQHLNRSLSQFVRRCLTFMDRGFVFQLIRYYLGQFSPGDARILQEFKFNFLQEICQHEHYVCLNLPFLLNPKNRPPEMMQHFNLSEEFCRQHFLSGVLLQEVRSALNEIGHIRRYALSIFKNLLAKHELDDRYQNRGQLSRIALLYMPWLSIVMDNSRRIDDISQVITPNDHVYSDSTSYTHRLSCSSSSVYGKDSTLNFHTSIMNSKNHLKMHLEHASPLRTSQHIKETDYLAAIAGAVISNSISNTSLNSLASDSQNSQNTTVGPTTYGDDPDNVEVTMRNGHNRSISVTHTQAAIRCDKFSSGESKDILLGFLFVIKHLSHDQMIGWWQNCNETETINFMSILELCLVQFRYVGKKNLSSNDESYEVRSLRTPKASTLPARTSPPANLENGGQIQHETGTLNLNQNRDILMDDVALNKRSLYESNLATEVGMIILDSLGLYSVEFRSKLHESLILPKLARVYLKFLQLGQSENLSKHVFAALRAFINNFSSALFNGNAILCGQMVYELLKACDSRLVQIRHESCAVLYLLMRSNFEFSGRKGLTRVHLQVIISVSQMIGNVIGLNNARFQESLSLINSYANSDKAMKGTGFPVEVKDLTRRVRTVLMATAQMQAHHMDPERLLELQYSLANSYAFTPELRHTWLVTMARNHEQNGNISEAACCHLHIAALMSEYLRLKGGCSIHWGSTAFSKISRNIPRDEQGLKLDAGSQDSQYTEHMLVEQLKQCAIFLTSAERYECLGDLYKLILPIYERTRMYNDLQESYEHLAKAYAKVIEVNRSGRRMLGRFYRVVFYGLSYFEEDHGIEYIYKEPKLTSLSEISQRLAAQYKEKFGADVVKLIMDSSPVDIQELDSKLAYVQVTHVIPFFSKGELDQRLNEFEQNHDVDTFMYETPFTKMGAARGSVEEQWKRKTVIKTTYSFPYVLKRIPVKSREIIELSPIEVAIDEMQTKVSELEEVILPPADIKKLQLRLQGSIAVTVNAGPLAYAQAFLDPKVVNNFSIDRVEDLKDVFRDFISVCHTALQLNARIISSDQKEYHNVLKENYQRLCQALSELLDQPYHAMEENSIMTATQRNSMALFNTISGTSTNSSTA